MVAPSARFERLLTLPRLVLRSMKRDNALVDASAMAFSLFLASIPMLALVGSLAARVLHGHPEALSLISSALDVAPAEVRELVDRHVVRGAEQSIAPLFLAGSLWLAAGAFHDALTVFENAAGVPQRSWVRKRLIGMGCVIALLSVLLLLAALVARLSGGPLSLLVTVARQAESLSPSLAAIVVGAPIAWILVGVFFRIAVRHGAERPPIWPGATATVLIGTGSSLLFASYAKELASYAVFYGSLAAVAVFLLWLWIGCVALLVGVEVNAVLERTVGTR